MSKTVDPKNLIGDPYCRDCVYRDVTNNIYLTCDYIGHTRRKRPCKAGKGCTVKATSEDALKKSAKPAERRTPAVRSRKWDTALGLRLYQEGKLDSEIAAAVGVKSHTICTWRQKMGLPTNYKARQKGGASCTA